MTSTNQVCKRCAGKGFFSNLVHVEGGSCFACDGTGFTVSKFDRFFKGCKGSFFGLTFQKQYGGKLVTVKQIAKYIDPSKEGFSVGVTFASITEEQARKFFAKYGDQTTV